MRNSALAVMAALLMATFPFGAARAQVSTPPPPASTPAADVVSIPAGTEIRAELTTMLSTKTSRDGDLFTARVVEPVFAKGEEIVQEGSTLEGHVTFIKEPGRAKGVGEMRLVADSITTTTDIKYTVGAGLRNAKGAGGAHVKGDEGTVVGEGKSKKDAAKEAGIGAGVGAGVGAIADGGTGSLYGLGIGAATSLIHSLIKKHKDLVLAQGTELSFLISRDVPGSKMTGATDQSSQ
ncbi:MAG TPA: hypothetical protein VG028_18730 [Terriglobia bacterium]|nr:hypothetical protein [Terriglobia bacterium]